MWGGGGEHAVFISTDKLGETLVGIHLYPTPHPSLLPPQMHSSAELLTPPDPQDLSTPTSVQVQSH